MPPGQCLHALELLPVEIYNFLIGCTYTKEKMPGCPSKMKHTGQFSYVVLFNKPCSDPANILYPTSGIL